MTREVQFSDAREIASQFGKVAAMDENETNANNVDVVLILKDSGKEVVALVSYAGDELCCEW